MIERAVILWSNPGETVLSPFAGVGSELYGAILNGRRAIGMELKPSYYRQAVKNLAEAVWNSADEDLVLLVQSAEEEEKAEEE